MKNAKNSPFVSIVIINAFSLENIEECIKSLKKVKYKNFEVIVVDYKTPKIEKIKNILKTHKLKLIKVNVDPGPSHMHNIGVNNSNSKSEYIIFLDSDTVVDPNFIKPLVSFIQKDKKIGAVQSAILLYQHPSKINTIGDMANYLAVGWSEAYGEKFKKQKNKEISFSSAAGMIVRKDVFKKVGGFDKKYFIYVDDLDLGIRIRIAGYKIFNCNESVIYHKYKFLRTRRNFYYLNRNRILTFLKMYKNKTTYLLMLPIWLMYELFVSFYGIFSGYGSEVIKVYKDVWDLREYVKMERKKISKFRKLSDGEMIRILGDKINFSEISKAFPIKYFLNPILRLYKKLLLILIK